jgi:hypothetical protein
MKTDIEFLRVLDEDLEEAAARETARGSERGKRARGSRHLFGPRWVRVAAAVTAFLVIAGGVGLMAQNVFGPAPAIEPASRPQSVVGVSPVPAAPIPGIIPRQRGVGRYPAANGPNYVGQNGAGASGGAYPVLPQADNLQTDLAKIVRTGSISIQIPDDSFTQRSIAVARVATDARGIVLDSSTQNQRSGTFTLKVPANNFQAAMAALAALGVVQSSEQIGKDVTAQYVDYTARLRILTGRRAVVLKLMSKATSISDTLYLQSQFDGVQLQIEQIQGNVNVLRNQVAESTITVDMAEKDSPKAAATAVRTPSLSKALRLAWQGSLRVVETILVGLGYLIPIALLGLIVFVLTRGARRRRAASSTL